MITMKFRLVLTALICSLFTVPLSAADGDNLLSRPDAENGPTPVRLSLYVIDITSIDGASGSFTADFILRQRWPDARLDVPGSQYRLNEIWFPRLAILNERNARSSLGDFIQVLQEGTAQFTQRYQGSFSSHYDFRRFPFDEQNLIITILSATSGSDDIELQFDTAGSTENLSVSGWTLEVQGGQVTAFKSSMSGESIENIERSQVDFTINATRNVEYYRWKVLLPLSIVVFLSWAVFMINPQQIGPQVGVSATSILTLIAFLIRLEGLMPPVSYLTHLDKFVYLSLLLVFLAYVEALATSRLAAQDKTLPLAETMDKWSRAMFPLAYAIIVYVFWMA